MRTFEANYRSADDVRSNEQRSKRAIKYKTQTEEQRNADWQADGLKDAESRGQFHAEFMSRYYAHAMALRDEISRRLGIFPPYRHEADSSVVLDNGMLAGVNPVTEAANYLDRRARKLP
jgi:hypothetical protein